MKFVDNPTDEEIIGTFKELSESHSSVIDLISGERMEGIPTFFMNIMEHSVLERLAGMPGYKENPVEIYRKVQENIGVNFLDQWIPENPLSMEREGYVGAEKGATTGAERIVRDGILIDSPDAVIKHMEEVYFKALQRDIDAFDENERIRAVGLWEYNIQRQVGENILKTPYCAFAFPHLMYNEYGYENYFCAYALEPEIMEKCFSLQAERARLYNAAEVKAFKRYGFPKLTRLDHDMTDSRGTLVSTESLEKIWYPNLYKALEPAIGTDITMIWHCDGNITPMVDPLLDIGIKGFQGFQYEDGVDYKAVCAKKAKDGSPLFIIGGCSVTRTLPMGLPEDVKKELKFLVDNKGKSKLALSASSSIAPGVAWENIMTLIEGLKYYRTKVS